MTTAGLTTALNNIVSQIRNILTSAYDLQYRRNLNQPASAYAGAITGIRAVLENIQNAMKDVLTEGGSIDAARTYVTAKIDSLIAAGDTVSGIVTTW
ncbi:unnamed protein product, partial [marine sediment metagenome]